MIVIILEAEPGLSDLVVGDELGNEAVWSRRLRFGAGGRQGRGSGVALSSAMVSVTGLNMECGANIEMLQLGNMLRNMPLDIERSKIRIKSQDFFARMGVAGSPDFSRVRWRGWVVP